VYTFGERLATRMPYAASLICHATEHTRRFGALQITNKERFISMPEYNNKNIVLHELIGLKVEVVKSLDKYQKGVKGKVIDETRNTLLVFTASGETKRVLKNISTFKFIAGKNRFIVTGEEIRFRPFERTEKGMKYFKRRKL